jgi:hypothetical protein
VVERSRNHEFEKIKKIVINARNTFTGYLDILF